MKKIFKTVKNTKGEEYSVIITLTDDGEVVLDKSSCTCEFGSWWRFAGKWREKKKLCWHMCSVIDEIKKQQEDERKK